MLAKWDQRFLDLAHFVKMWSKDPSTKVGAVIAKDNRIVSLGFNGFPHGTDDNEAIYADRERKYKRVLHAERNAMIFAKRDLTDCTIYCTQPPCSQCTAHIIQEGISRVVCTVSEDFMSRWADDIAESAAMFREAGVVLEVYDE